MTLATFAVDYGWYAFFLTPTFVLMSLPHLRDWRFAGVRMGTTVIGALVALVAMRLLWPEREDVYLSRLLGSSAAAAAEYLRALPRFWLNGRAARLQAERKVLAPARREAGLRLLDAEETLDRLMLEPGLPRRGGGGERHAEALTFVTYLRRLLRAATTLASVGMADDHVHKRLEQLALRLDVMSAALVAGGSFVPAPTHATAQARAKAAAVEVGAQQMQRMERQVGILERAAVALRGTGSGRS